MNGNRVRENLLVAKGTFSAMGGAERDLIRVLPSLNRLFSVTMATINPTPELEEVCEIENIRLICPAESWKLPTDPISTILDTGRNTASKAWSRCNGIEEEMEKTSAIHLVSGDGSLPLIDLFPENQRIHLHLLEPHRGLYEDTLHRTIDGSLKRNLKLTEKLLSRARRRDQSLMKSLLDMKNSIVSANSNFSATRTKEVYGINAGVLWPCVDIAEFPSDPSKDPANPYVGPDGGYVVSIGRASWAKGTWETLSMLRGTGVSLAHVGGGDEDSLNKLRDYANTIEVGLWVAPRLPSPKLVSLMRGAVAIVSMAHSESFGLSPIEAFSVGTPALFVDEGGFRDTIIDGINGRLIPRGDKLGWNKALKQASDLEIRERWSKAGRQRISDLDLSPDAHASRLKSIIFS